MDCGAFLDPLWHERLLVLMYWGITMGYVAKGTDGGLLVAGGVGQGVDVADEAPVADAPSASGRGSEGLTMARQQEKLKRLRSSAKNTLHCSLLVLSDPDNQRRLRIIMALCAPTRLWHGSQSCTLRSPAAARQWYAEQAAGECLKHIVDTLALLSDPSALGTCFFGTTPVEAKGKAPDLVEFGLQNEDAWFDCAATREKRKGHAC